MVLKLLRKDEILGQLELKSMSWLLFTLGQSCQNIKEVEVSLSETGHY